MRQTAIFFGFLVVLTGIIFCIFSIKEKKKNDSIIASLALVFAGVMIIITQFQSLM